MQLDMTKGNPLSLMLRFMLPLLLGNIFQQLYNMADTIIVGRYVGSGALAAVGSTGTVMFLLTGFAQGITSGFSVLTAQRFGAGDTEGMKKSVASGTVLAAVCTLLITLLSAGSMKLLLALMNTPQEIFADAYTYIVIVAAGIAATVLYNLFSAFLRAVGNSRVPLYTLVFSASLNVGLDLLLIIRFDMGVAGAAIATVLSQLLSGLICVAYVFRCVPELRPERRHFRIDPRDAKTQLQIGIPMALQFSITACGNMVMQSAINLFGATAIAAYTAACKAQNILMQGMIAMGQTMAVYGGQNTGKCDLPRILRGVRSAVLMEVVYSLLAAFLLTLLLPYVLLLFFPSGEELAAVMPYARVYVSISVIFYIPLSMIFIFRNIMQGCGYSLFPMLGGVMEMFARLFFAFLAIRTESFVLACSCDPAAWVAAAVFLVITWRIVLRRMKISWGALHPDR